MASQTDLICGTDVKTESFEKILSESFSSTCEIKQVSEVGKGRGFNSQVFRVFLNWELHDTALPDSVILKVCSFSPDREGLVTKDESKIMKAHNAECEIYQNFSTDLPVPTPKCYYTHQMSIKESGVIIMEDIRDGIVVPVTEGLTHQQLIQFAEMMAHLHTYSIVYERWKTSEDLCMNISKIAKVGQDYTGTLVDAIAKLRANWGSFFEPLLDQLVDIYKSLEPRELIAPKESLNNKFKLPKILVQGDMWISNLMWKKDPESGKATDQLISVIDWQLSHPGCVTEDFTDCLTTSVTTEMRRKYTNEVLGHYYTTLRKELGQQPPFSQQTLFNAYKQCFKLQVLMLIPAFASFPKQKELLGDEQEAKMPGLLERAKALIEDAVAYCQTD